MSRQPLDVLKAEVTIPFAILKKVLLKEPTASWVANEIHFSRQKIEALARQKIEEKLGAKLVYCAMEKMHEDEIDEHAKALISKGSTKIKFQFAKK